MLETCSSKVLAPLFGHRSAGKTASLGVPRIGLPFETDTAITRHLAAFAAQGKRRQTGSAEPRAVQRRSLQGRSAPHAALGPGTVVPRGVAIKLLPALTILTMRWLEERPLRLGEGTRRMRIRRHSPGVLCWDRDGLAIPAPVSLECLRVVPFGMEEGTETDVLGRDRLGRRRTGHLPFLQLFHAKAICPAMC